MIDINFPNAFTIALIAIVGVVLFRWASKAVGMPALV